VVGGYFVVLLLLCLTGLWRVLPDSSMLVGTMSMDQLSPFRIQVVRSILDLATTTGLLLVAALPLIRSPRPGSPQAPA